MALSIVMVQNKLIMFNKNVLFPLRRKMKKQKITVGPNLHFNINNIKGVWMSIKHTKEEEKKKYKYLGDPWPLITSQDTPDPKALLEKLKEKDRPQQSHIISIWSKPIFHSKTELYLAIIPQVTSYLQAAGISSHKSSKTPHYLETLPRTPSEKATNGISMWWRAMTNWDQATIVISPNSGLPEDDGLVLCLHHKHTIYW